ncbi:TfoX/Sxy family protein [Magnetofaba australis]|uniref:TfoX N-terminal domain-containing protein n=1 Tax=Magnetofaba australis IT-1 TaxID=1434232 RepID=A0A1Y2K021_9PROT|nr:TfoX/Sxy family protein [Magnetofaba australis]OSM00439.1 hypothetical protein MAIT1_00959 [Magnetofaba australis IT-1]
MPYDPELAERLAAIVDDLPGMRPIQMFGGVGFLLNGNMCVGVWREWLILRVGAEQAERCLQQPDMRPMDITGRVMTGWVMAGPQACAENTRLLEYVRLALDFTGALPPKMGKTQRK